jgi:hypothetical protein
MTGLGILFVNPQVQPTQTIYIKAIVFDVFLVLMVEAAAFSPCNNDQRPPLLQQHNFLIRLSIVSTLSQCSEPKPPSKLEDQIFHPALQQQL